MLVHTQLPILCYESTRFAFFRPVRVKVRVSYAFSDCLEKNVCIEGRRGCINRPYHRYVTIAYTYVLYVPNAPFGRPARGVGRLLMCTTVQITTMKSITFQASSVKGSMLKTILVKSNQGLQTIQVAKFKSSLEVEKLEVVQLRNVRKYQSHQLCVLKLKPLSSSRTKCRKDNFARHNVQGIIYNLA